MKRITEYTNIETIAESDVLPIVDVSDTEQATTGSTRKGTVGKIADYIKDRAETLTNKILTTARLNTPKINEDVTVTATSTELNKLDGMAGDAVGTTDTQTLTNKTITSPVLNTGVSGTAILDEDDMASDSATQLATQQSIRAFVGSKVIARRILTSATTSVSITDIPAYTNLKIIVRQTASTGGAAGQGGITMTFNNDTATNYSYIRNLNNVGFVSSTGKGSMEVSPNYGGPQQVVFEIINGQNQEKFGYGVSVSSDASGTTGAGVVPMVAHYYSKWANTSQQITRIDFSRNVQSFGIGTEFIIIGR